MTQLRVLTACVSALLVMAATGQPPRVTECPYHSRGPLRLSRDSVGPLPAHATLAALRRMCPTATTTSVYGFEEEFPGLEFAFPSLWAVAFQKRDTLDQARPADAWEVKGCNAVLPHGISACASWADVARAYGPRGSGNEDFGPLIITLATLPGFELQLDAQDAVGGDLSHIPPTARIVRVRINSQ
jgi:hypothetical protein